MREVLTARRAVTLAILGGLCLMLAACGSSGGDSSTSAATSDSASTTSTTGGGGGASGLKGAGKSVGLVVTGYLNDHASGEAADNGLLAAKQAYGVKVNTIDNVPDPDSQERAVKALTAQNGLVIGIATSLTPFFTAAATANPDKAFVLGNAPMTGAPKNAFGVQPDWNQFGYMAGVVATGLSKSKTVGFIGGALAPTITAGRDGFKRGATEADPKTKVLTAITGSFTDPAKTKAAADSQIAAGADVLWLETDSAFSGAVQAAQAADHKVLIVGSVSPHCDDSGGLDVGDAVVDWSAGVKDIVNEWLGGTLKSMSFGYESPLAAFDVCETASKAQVEQIVKQTKAKIADGTIKFPAAKSN